MKNIIIAAFLSLSMIVSTAAAADSISIVDAVAAYKEWNAALKAEPFNAERFRSAEKTWRALPKKDREALNSYGNLRYTDGQRAKHCAGETAYVDPNFGPWSVTISESVK